MEENLSRIYDLDIPMSKKIVLIYLSYKSSTKTKSCSASILEICKHTSASKHTILRAIRFLAQEGLISVNPGFSGESNKYHTEFAYGGD